MMKELVEKAFAKDGAIVTLGGYWTAEQAEYAQYIAVSLEGIGHQAMLEAETGIGKSLGYLIPSLIYLNEHEKSAPIAISTFTRSLQKQIVNNDLPFALSVLKELGILNTVQTAYRMGKQAFFSPSRTKEAIETVLQETPTAAETLATFLKYVEASCAGGSGLISDYLDDYMVLPCGLKYQDICLLDTQVIDNEAYKLHRVRAENARLLIMNHASLIIYPQLGFKEDTLHAVIVDEAHAIEGVCQQMFNYRRPVVEIPGLITRAAKELPKRKYLKATAELAADWRTTLKQEQAESGADIWTHAQFDNKLNAQMESAITISKGLRKCQKELEKEYGEKAISTKQATLLARLDYMNKAISRWIENNGTYANNAILFSPKLAEPSIATINIFAARIFNKLMLKLTDNIILTSATISDAKKNFLSFKNLAYTLGLDSAMNTAECSLSPSKYGELSFVLAPPDGDKPVVMDDDEVLFNQGWLDDVTKMLSAAKREGGSILMLTSSFKETAAIYQAMSDRTGILYHKQGSSLNEYLGEFIAGNKQILITPGAWEGVSLKKKNGEQLIKHLMISRVPFTPPDYLFEKILEEYRQRSGGAKNYTFLNQMQETVIRLKQGIGRGLRGPNFSVKVWICDSRMPSYSDNKTSRALINAIPKRFLNAYKDAAIFGEEKRKVVLI